MMGNPMSNALAQLKGQEMPMTSTEDGTEVFVDKGLYPGKVKSGDAVLLHGTVSSVGTKLGVQISGIEAENTSPEVQDVSEGEPEGA